MSFSNKNLLAVNTETSCCESMLITCFAFCLEVKNVIWEMRFKFALCRDCLKRFIFVIMLDHFIVSFLDRLDLAFDEWRMLILDYRVTYVCSRLVERRLWWNVIKIDETSHQIHCERLIKLDESDSSNLMSENVISSNLTKATHQTW
jgi:hypothetical protein